MSYIRLLAIVSLMTLLPSVVAGQAKWSLPINFKSTDLPCVSQLEINNPTLLKELERLFTHIGDYELPIIALERKGDSLFCYVSALMSTHAIQQNPPTAIVKILNREALLYTGTESVAQLTMGCKEYLIRKYLDILHADNINKKSGLPPGTDWGGTYDPVLVKINIQSSEMIFMRNFGSFPYFTY